MGAQAQTENWDQWKARQMRRPAVEHMVLANGAPPAGNQVKCGFCKAYKFKKGDFRCQLFGNDAVVWRPEWNGCGKFASSLAVDELPPDNTDAK